MTEKVACHWSSLNVRSWSKYLTPIYYRWYQIRVVTFTDKALGTAVRATGLYKPTFHI